MHRYNVLISMAITHPFGSIGLGNIDINNRGIMNRNIKKTCPYNVYQLIPPLLYRKQLGYAGV